MQALRTLALFALVTPAAWADVWIVDKAGGAGVHFTEIQFAVDAAAPGDTILVRPGSYGFFTVDGKGLEVMLEEGPAATGQPAFLIGSHVRVLNLPATESVLLRGFFLNPGGQFPAVAVRDCAGPVWLEDSTINDSYLPDGAQAGLLVRRSDAVSVVGCQIEGTRGTGARIFGGPGLDARDSVVHVHDSILVGGAGGVIGGARVEPGPGAVIDGGLLVGSGSTLQGGAGGLGGIFGCLPGVDGGTGLQLVAGDPVARLLDCVVAGGAAGLANAPCLPGTVGAPQEVLSGEVCIDAVPGRSIEMTETLRSGETIELTVQGEPGDRVWLLLSAFHAPTYFPAKGQPLVGGALLPDLTRTSRVSLGTLDANGELEVQAPAPPVSGARTFYAQAVLFAASPQGEVVLSSAASLTVLGPGL